MKKKFHFTAKFAASVAVLFSAFIIIQALVFNYTIEKNSEILSSQVIEAAEQVMTAKAAAIGEAAAVEMPGKKFSRTLTEKKLRNAAMHCEDVLGIILFSPTADENFFRPLAVIQTDSRFSADIDMKKPVQAAGGKELLKKALLGPAAEDNICYCRDIPCRNIYVPVKTGRKTFAAQIVFEAGRNEKITDSFNSVVSQSMKIMLISSGMLAVIIIILTVLFTQRHSVLVNQLSRYMKQAAEGDLELTIKQPGDRELDCLADSFNTLMEEMRQMRQLPSEKGEAAGNVNSRFFKYGTALLRQGKAAQALSVFEFLETEDPSSFASFFNAGVILAKMKRYQEALEHLEKACAINPAFELTVVYTDRIKKIINENRNV